MVAVPNPRGRPQPLNVSIATSWRRHTLTPARGYVTALCEVRRRQDRDKRGVTAPTPHEKALHMGTGPAPVLPPLIRDPKRYLLLLQEPVETSLFVGAEVYCSALLVGYQVVLFPRAPRLKFDVLDSLILGELNVTRDKGFRQLLALLFAAQETPPCGPSATARYSARLTKIDLEHLGRGRSSTPAGSATRSIGR